MNDKFVSLWNPTRNLYITGTVDEAGTLPVSSERCEHTGTLKYDGSKFVGYIQLFRTGGGPDNNCAWNIEMTKQ
jgi:hypothetical protein